MTKELLYERMRENGIPCKQIKTGENTCVIVIERGGRIIGFFQDGMSENLFWTSPLLNDKNAAAILLSGNEWNIGGDRLWFGPEIRYSVADRNRFWETLHTPESIDPGNYRMAEKDGRCILSQEMDIEEKNGNKERASLKIERYILACPNPLRELEQYEWIMHGVSFSGYQQILDLEGEGASIEGWNLLQVNPGGNVYIPMYQPCRGVDYYEPACKYEMLLENAVMLKATGNNRYKVGYKSASTVGRIAYACRWNDQDCLIVRNFPNDPSGFYGEEPPHLFGEKGFSIHVYNDNGNPPSFTELECSIPSILGGRRKRSSDVISTWVFTGKRQQLRMIGKILLGTNELLFSTQEEKEDDRR